MSETWPELARERAERVEVENEQLRHQVLALKNAGMEAAAQLGEAEDAYMLCIELKDEARAEVERLREDITRQEVTIGRLLRVRDENERLRNENLALVDAMRDARALLHKPRPQAMAAASLLGDALTTRALEMLPEEGEDDV